MNVDRYINHIQHCVDNFYATEHTPQFNWTEWQEIQEALQYVKKLKLNLRRKRYIIRKDKRNGN